MEFIMALRDLVKDVHTEAEDSPFAKLLMSGSITQDQYAHYLYQQKYIYEALETRADHLGILDEIPHIKRTDKISHDLASLETQTSCGLFPSVLNYVQYVNSLSEDRCWAHVYVRHFGDMYGGNMISKRIPFGDHTMYQFEDKKGLIEYVRSKLNDDMSTEARLVFKHATNLFKELEHVYNL
jgi:heme oxygenase